MIFARKDLACCFSAKPYNMSLCHGDTQHSLENRKKFLGLSDIPHQDLVCAKQIHSNNIYKAEDTDKGRGALSYETAICDTDALITGERKLPLGIFTADCLPVFIYEPHVRVAAMVHAGWRSTKKLICQRVIKKMSDEFDADPERLLVGFGPAIRSCCYEVQDEFTRHFSYGLDKKDGKYYLDLARINIKQLLESGVKQDSIYDSGICTACPESAYFSFRRDGAGCGRMISVIMLK